MSTQDLTNEADEPPAEQIRYILLPPDIYGECHSLEVNKFIRLESVGDNTCVAFFANRETGLEPKSFYSHGIGRFVEDFKGNPQLRRVHRSHIINLEYMLCFNKKTQVITLKNKDRLPLGPSYKEDFYRDIYCF